MERMKQLSFINKGGYSTLIPKFNLDWCVIKDGQNDEFYSYIRSVMDTANIYAEVQSGGNVWFDVQRIVDNINEIPETLETEIFE